MDPLSVTASAIAIGSIPCGLAKGFRLYKQIHDAPDEVKTLIHELADAQTAVDQAETIALARLSRAPPSDRSTTWLLEVIETSNKTILELEAIIYEKLIKDEDSTEKIRLARRAWCMEKSKIDLLRKGLWENKMNLLFAVSSASL